MIPKIFEYCNCYRYKQSIVAECYSTYDEAYKNIIKEYYGDKHMIIMNKYWPLFIKKQIINFEFHLPTFYYESKTE